jgi:hypothetical protein
MSDTSSVQSTGSIHSSHSQDGNADKSSRFKDDMISFLESKDGLYACNRLIAKEAWRDSFGVQYSPFETYGLKLQQLVEKYPETFYFEGKGHHKWICLTKYKEKNSLALSKDNSIRPASRPAPRPAPREPTISADDVAYFVSALDNLSMADFMKLASECIERGLDPNSLKLLAEQVVVN